MKLRKGRPTVAEIDRAALRANYGAVRQHVPENVEVLAVVKADAYGHGGPEVARVLEREGVKQFGVATVEEGGALRGRGIVYPEVLVLCGLVAEQVDEILQYRLTPVVCDLEMARVLDHRLHGAMRRLPVHLKVDTGLGRLGVPMHELGAVLPEIAKLEHVQVAGVLTHLGSAVNVVGARVDAQLQAFERALAELERAGFGSLVRHVANSSAVLVRPDTYFDVVRPGLVLYGLFPGGAPQGPIELTPVMRLRTEVLQIRTLPAGHGIGYDRRFVTERESRIATLPVGYADGYPRSLSSTAEVL
ncbi:MAG: alanine racemase, partial [Candidatus Binatota bacterium]|nr:alanine racemase [Candidatus Binatota bacterium]